MPKHVKWGPLEVFLTSILLQSRQKNEGWTLWRYLRKKSHKAETSRERPKSEPYLRLKKTKGLQSVKYSLLQYPFEEKLKKIPIFLKFLKFFWSPVSRIVPKHVKWGPLEVF